MIRGGAAEGSPGFPFVEGIAPADAVTSLAWSGRPFLAAITSLLMQEHVMPGNLDDGIVSAFGQVNPGRSDRAALQGAAISFASQSLVQTRVVGRLAPGTNGSAQAQQWQMLFEGRAGTGYDEQLTPDLAKKLFYEEDQSWAMIVRTPVDGRLPRPLVVGLHDGDQALVYDPAGREEGRASEYTMSVDDLLGRAALYDSFGLLAVRPYEYGIMGTPIVSPL